MVPSEQLAAAVARLEPRDREVLYLSLHKRVPDEALARLYGCSPPAVAHLRAEAIDRLAGDLGVRRGDDLGSVLTALLEPETWAEVEGGLEPAPTAPAAAEPEAAGPETGGPAAAEPPSKRRRRRGLRLAAAGIAAAGLLAAGGYVGATELVEDDDGATGGDDQAATRRFVPKKAGALRAPFPSEPTASSCYPTALIQQAAVLYNRPGGRRKLRLPARTEWKSPRVFGVVRQRGRWLAVQAPEMRNGEVGWLPADRARLDCVTWSLHADLSRRVLIVRRSGKRVRRIAMGVGRKANPTPKGRFAVTDKLSVSDGGQPYGCCVLALTGHQTRLPPNWPGGDRLAVHATANASDLGKQVSLGCLRVLGGQAKWLIENVPLGAPVFIRS